jgi:site-specific recombinase XerD
VTKAAATATAGEAARKAAKGKAELEVAQLVEAARAAFDGVTWHSLRHHHASALLSAGVSPAYVAERIGDDIQTLIRTYAHVIRSDEDKVRKLVDETLGGSAEDWLRTKAV